MKDRKSRAVGGCTAGSTSSAQADAGGEIIYDESERECVAAPNDSAEILTDTGWHYSIGVS